MRHGGKGVEDMQGPPDWRARALAVWAALRLTHVSTARLDDNALSR